MASNNLTTEMLGLIAGFRMLDPALTDVSSSDKTLAVHCLKILVKSLGDEVSREISTPDMYRLLSFMTGLLLEATSPNMTEGDRLQAGSQLGELIAFHASQVQRLNERGCYSLIDEVLDAGTVFERSQASHGVSLA